MFFSKSYSKYKSTAIYVHLSSPIITYPYPSSQILQCGDSGHFHHHHHHHHTVHHHHHRRRHLYHYHCNHHVISYWSTRLLVSSYIILIMSLLRHHCVIIISLSCHAMFISLLYFVSYIIIMPATRRKRRASNAQSESVGMRSGTCYDSTEMTEFYKSPPALFGETRGDYAEKARKCDAKHHEPTTDSIEFQEDERDHAWMS